MVSSRKQQTFTQWLGLKQCYSEKSIYIYTTSVSVVFGILGYYILHVLKGIEISTSEFEGLGFSAVPAILVYAVFNTALPEEIFFRGFLLKRLSIKFGFYTGNIIQAIIFGLLHGTMFFSLIGAVKTIIIILFTAIIAWFMGYINEQKANGSIIPSWIIHSFSNIFAGICAAFSII